MPDDDAAEISLSHAAPETVLSSPPPEWSDALASALASAPDGPTRLRAVRAVAGSYPRFLDAWATLAELTGEIEPVQSYSYARVGYHRGLDALRAAGWKGSGYVRWSHPTNRGFLRSLDALRRAASVIGERDEAERCAVFLRQLDPDWRAG